MVQTYPARVTDDAVDSLRTKVRGSVLLPDDDGYDVARQVWNSMIDRRPALIVQCSGAADVIEAVTFAREHDLLISVRGGGHNVAGTAVADDALMIDLSRMRGVHVDPRRMTVRVQGGATLGEVDRETQVFGLATPTGGVSTTGVAGITLGGGFGAVRNKYGLMCDNLLSADIVTADGRLLTVSAEENADLFWAIRGGGGNFGVVTSFEFRLYPIGPTIAVAATFYRVDQAPKVIPVWRDFMAQAPDEISSFAMFWTVPEVPAFPPEAQGQPIFAVAAHYAGDVEEGLRLLQPLRELGEVVLDLSGPWVYTVIQSGFDPFFPAGQLRYYWKATYLDELSDPAIERIIRAGMNRQAPRSAAGIIPFGGAVRRVAPDATAFGERRAWMVSFDSNWVDPADDARNIAWSRNSWASLREIADGGFYVNFPGQIEEGDTLARAAYGANYDRLVAIKTKYDPDNRFRMNVNIRPKATAG